MRSALRRLGLRALGLAALATPACGPEEPPPGTPPATDTDTSEPQILPLDSYGLPEDTAPEPIPDLSPRHFVIVEQAGTWTLSSASPPFAGLTGALTLREYVDALDTAEPVYECNVTYTLAGAEDPAAGCAGCDFGMAVTYTVAEGDPGACHDPDAPRDGAVWRMGFDGRADKILVDYADTGLWLPWYDATRAGATVTFSWTARLGVEIEDTGP